MHSPPPYKALRSCGIYRQGLRKAIHRLKYHHDIGLGDSLSHYLIHKFQSLNWPIDIIIPVPTSPKRAQERGYNQASVLGRPLSLAFRLPFRPDGLHKRKDTKSQVGLNPVERTLNVEGAFEANHRIVHAKNILVIDDVTTTGATMQACSKELLKSGAKEVYGLTLAKAVIEDDITTTYVM